MYILTGSSSTGKRFATLAPAVLVALLATNLNAETVRTVNGVDIESSMLNFYLKSRTQRPVEQVTAEERASLLDELTDIYLLSTGEAADAAAADPELMAQLELQRRGVIAQTMAAKFFETAEVKKFWRRMMPRRLWLHRFSSKHATFLLKARARPWQ